MQVIPSQEQEAILQSRAPTLMIEARAGTGKTTTLAMLAAREHGVVLGLCFSDGARIRFEDKLRDEAPGRKVTVLTVEGLARSLLNRLIQGSFFDKPSRLASAEQLRRTWWTPPTPSGRSMSSAAAANSISTSNTARRASSRCWNCCPR
ncbi:hypothetical protein ACHMW6_02175 [Pseudoduganella sp. UC29_106]|uniref:hypothetical protein n=1 Tax=Pseudoduganella sp. UC29_106 TaxID=3374553 RepID=UPI0037563B1B